MTSQQISTRPPVLPHRFLHAILSAALLDARRSARARGESEG